jgi:phosphoglycerate dehydrogenase-like enzyme
MSTEARGGGCKASARSDFEPLTTFDEPRARAHAEGRAPDHWVGCLIDGHALDRAPLLRAIVHAAGTVKQHMTDACWERGLQVTSAAAANALPVAEYTLAAILFANKRAFAMQRRYAEVREFRWWPLEFPGLGNYAKVVGIVGASFVGRRVIELLKPFDFESSP